jgi:stage III sporulation protein AB
MIYAAGAALIVAGTTAAGFTAAAGLKTHARTLASLTSALGFLSAEIGFGYAPLPDACAKTAAAFPELKPLFEPCSAEITSGGGFEPRWRGGAKALSLKQDELAVLVDLGRSLGHFDARIQQTALEQAVGRTAAFAERARLEQRDKSRLYSFMGIAAGLAAAILMI